MSRRAIMSWLGARTAKRNMIVVGLKSDNHSREMLLRFLMNSIVEPGDCVFAIHVPEFDNTFDPNTFHIHEDLCKSKQVDFQVKICAGNSYITELTHQVRITFATILALGCSSQWPKDSTIAKFLKALPPTCNLLIMDNGGRILFRKEGTSQQGTNTRVLQSSSLSISGQPKSRPPVRKSSSMPSSSISEQTQSTNFVSFQRLAMLETKGLYRRFAFEELHHGTKGFSPNVLIGEGGHSRVYRAILENGKGVAVKVLNDSQYSKELFFQEVEILSGVRHENIVEFLGYCCCDEMSAIVYNLLNSNLKQRLKQLNWNERMQIAVDVAKALEYLHSCYPPIIHRDVKSSNILLSVDCKPRLSDFGAAIVHSNFQNNEPSQQKKQIHVTGTLGYLAPEYMMYGKVDEKIDVYSYGVVLLELITGKEAIQKTSSISTQESLVLQARSLLSRGLFNRLIDPNLNQDYNKDEMKRMTMAARLCLLHSSSTRPSMKTVII
ncbi:hypothetical protein RD792_002221 [Penstemon davidsonii]|uniref:Protein kinase domain-containing protein n=1 Tax=Penstemon davidsonii TaxID=160366 RepID=A0ABR0DRI5_9LAMI|nr:hypothetical protein RD792_002221 [Penstemon davidsonii]